MRFKDSIDLVYTTENLILTFTNQFNYYDFLDYIYDDSYSDIMYLWEVLDWIGADYEKYESPYNYGWNRYLLCAITQSYPADTFPLSITLPPPEKTQEYDTGKVLTYE